MYIQVQLFILTSIIANLFSYLIVNLIPQSVYSHKYIHGITRTYVTHSELSLNFFQNESKHTVKVFLNYFKVYFLNI